MSRARVDSFLFFMFYKLIWMLFSWKMTYAYYLYDKTLLLETIMVGFRSWKCWLHLQPTHIGSQKQYGGDSTAACNLSSRKSDAICWTLSPAGTCFIQTHMTHTHMYMHKIINKLVKITNHKYCTQLKTRWIFKVGITKTKINKPIRKCSRNHYC